MLKFVGAADRANTSLSGCTPTAVRVPVDSRMARAAVTSLESVAPWKYKTWDRKLTALAEQKQATMKEV
jgi:hypothetical protein